MPYCPNGHGTKPGPFCDQCGAQVDADPPATRPRAGDSVRVRSPSASADVHQAFYLPGAEPQAQPVLLACPVCGRRNLESEVFDCRGPCGRQNLCLRHLDEEVDVCQQCAAQAGGSSRRQLEARLSSLRDEARAQLETGSLAQALVACGRALELAPEDPGALRLLQACEDRLQRYAAEAERGREAQARLAEIEERERAAEEARRQAEEEAARAPIWQQMGIEMVTIPAGEFLYGEKKERAHLPTYYLARTPVTNLQYKAFAEATGHRRPGHWSEGQIPPGKDDHPVVNVS